MACCFVCIETGFVGLKERFGAFASEVPPGCSCIIPCVENVKLVNMRLQSLNVKCESKTRDNVFVQVEVCVQYKVVNPVKSYYEMQDPHNQIKAYVFDVIRSEVPQLNLDDVFLEKEKLSAAVKSQLTEELESYGFKIVHTPVTDLDPDQNVKRSLNEMMTQKNLKAAMKEKAQADAIVQIELAKAAAEEIRIKAEADAHAKHQSGLGLSMQRKAIVDGLTESVNIFQEGVEGVDSRTIMDLIMITQYFDMMEKIGCSENRGTNTLFVPSGPGTVGEYSRQLRQHVLEGAEQSKAMKSTV